MEKEQYIVALEIGSSKIIGAVATKNARGAVSVIAIEEEKVVDCVRYGCIQNVEETNTRINRIIKKLENRSSISPRKIKGVYVGISGRSLRNIVTEVERALNDEMAITEQVIENIKEESIRVPFAGFDILDVVPRRYAIDKVEAKSPVGMFGSHINAKLNLIVAKPQIKTNLKRVLDERLQLAVKGYFITPICVANDVLTSDERQLGCMLVDFGAETTTVSIYKNDVLMYLATLPLGSRNITRDITSLKVLEESAEEIKKTIGNAIASESESSRLNIEGISAGEVSNYIVARVGEIVANIIEQIAYADMTADDIPGGIIVVGGGAKLKGFTELLEQQSKLRVRKGNVGNQVNILEGRINSADYVQVISLLSKGAEVIGPNDDCCELPPNQDVGKTQDQNLNLNIEEKSVQEPKEPKRTFGKKILEKLRASAENMFKEGSDEEDDDDDDEKR